LPVAHEFDEKGRRVRTSLTTKPAADRQ